MFFRYQFVYCFCLVPRKKETGKEKPDGAENQLQIMTGSIMGCVALVISLAISCRLVKQKLKEKRCLMDDQIQPYSKDTIRPEEQI